MTKLATRFLLAGAVVAVAIAMSVAPGEAAKTCGNAGAVCSTKCTNGVCSVYVCGGDGAWYPAVLTPFCPQGNCVNVRKRC